MCPNCGNIRFVAEPAANEIRGGICYSTFAGEDRPRYAAPVHVVRRYCETTIRQIAAWERAERQRGAVVEMGRPPAHG